MAKKRLVNKLREKKSQPARKGVVAVLARKEEITEALGEGFTMREIHTVMVEEGKMPVSYAAFTRLVNKYIKGKEQQKNSPAKKSEKPKSHIFNPDDYDEKDLF